MYDQLTYMVTQVPQTTLSTLMTLPQGGDKVRSDKNLYVKRSQSLGRDVSNLFLFSGPFYVFSLDFYVSCS